MPNKKTSSRKPSSRENKDSKISPERMKRFQWEEGDIVIISRGDGSRVEGTTSGGDYSKRLKDMVAKFTKAIKGEDAASKDD